MHEGILYVYDPRLVNRNYPPFSKSYMMRNITPIGLQPFLRPACQKGYALHLAPNDSTRCWAYRIRFNGEDSMSYFEKFHEGKDLWVSDILCDKTKQIAELTSFSNRVFDCAVTSYRPKGYSKTQLRSELRDMGIVIAKTCQEVTFTDEEKAAAVAGWNQTEGAHFCDIIGRKPWIIERDGCAATMGQKIQIDKRFDFRTIESLEDIAWLRLIRYADTPEHGEWIDYIPKQISRKGCAMKDTGWKKVPAKMFPVATTRYLTEEDYLIPEGRY